MTAVDMDGVNVRSLCLAKITICRVISQIEV